jgi:hypothetical protein
MLHLRPGETCLHPGDFNSRMENGAQGLIREADRRDERF